MRFDEWKETHLSDCAELYIEKYKDDGNPYKYVGLEHIEQQTLRLRSVGSNQDIFSAKNKFYSGDILFGKLRPYFRKVVKPDFDGICSTDIWVIRAKKDVDQNFLFYLLASNEFVDYASQGSKGTRMPRADWDFVSKKSIKLPSKDEQKSIAAILSSLDNKIDINNKINQTLEEMAQAIFKHWFVDFEFPNENGEPYKSSGGEMVDSPLGPIPKGWKIAKIEDIVSQEKNAIVDGPFGTQLHSVDYKSEGIPVVRIINLSFEGSFINNELVFIDEEKFHKLKRSATYPGDILLAKTGATIGKFSILPSYINKSIIASSILKITPLNNRYYIYNVIKGFSKKDYWSKISSGSTRATINLSDVKKIEITVPADKILKRYEILIEKFHFLMELKEMESQRLDKLRDNLLPKLMSGEISVNLENGG